MNDYIIRKKHKKSFKYYDKKGNLLSKSTIQKYLTFYIPPGYDNVKINKKRGKILAIGYDEKKRPQYIYNKNFTNKQSVLKFNKLIDFGINYDKINDKIKNDLTTHFDSKNKQIATILMIIIDCNFRVGNEKYTIDNKSYGVTTLEKRHLKSKNGNLIIDFIGKKGVKNKCVVKNKTIKRNLTKKKKLLTKNQKLFRYRNKNDYFNIKSSDVNDYLKKLGNYSTKYFRTWSANTLLIKELLNENINFKKAIENVANYLHHTPSICKKNYLDPKLIKFYEKNNIYFINYFKNKNINHTYTKFLKSQYK
jgi:DNA topoisomerase I